MITARLANDLDVNQYEESFIGNFTYKNNNAILFLLD